MSTKERQDSNERSDYPKIPSDFHCFVCGARFATNEESSTWKRHPMEVYTVVNLHMRGKIRNAKKYY